MRLASYAERLAAAGTVQTGPVFTDVPGADALLRHDANAFLLGVLFTQGIPAERAWAGPFLLRQRLGHLELQRLADEPEAVAAAVASTPALHRFKNTLARWISEAARALLDDWGGDARNLWADRPTMTELRARLESFPGIGRKKAAMAAEILVRSLGVEVETLSGGTVAYDVHVRRVFLRSGLIDSDHPRDVERAALRACPKSPGALDLATWSIGRQWCHPTTPECDACWLGDVCPRMTGRSVEGVAARKRPK